MLLAIYLYEDFINIEGVAVSIVLSLQSSRVERSKLDAPEADLFPSDDDASFSQ